MPLVYGFIVSTPILGSVRAYRRPKRAIYLVRTPFVSPNQAVPGFEDSSWGVREDRFPQEVYHHRPCFGKIKPDICFVICPSISDYFFSFFFLPFFPTKPQIRTSLLIYPHIVTLCMLLKFGLTIQKVLFSERIPKTVSQITNPILGLLVLIWTLHILRLNHIAIQLKNCDILLNIRDIFC